MTSQTGEAESSTTLAFRCSQTTAHLVRAAAATQQITPSSWLRDAVTQALQNDGWRERSGTWRVHEEPRSDG